MSIKIYVLGKEPCICYPPDPKQLKQDIPGNWILRIELVGASVHVKVQL